jgi:hypothetical protein
MALEKQITTQHGVVANYWKVDHIEIQYDQKTVFVKVNPYLNKSARDNDKRALDEVYESRPSFDNVIASENIRENIYTELKKEDFFSGATDV